MVPSTNRNDAFSSPEDFWKEAESSWIPSRFWKYLAPSRNTKDQQSTQGKTLAFQSVKQNMESIHDWVNMPCRADEGLLEEALRVTMDRESSIMRRVDAESADELFAEYDLQTWTPTRNVQESPQIAQVSEILFGLEAIAEFVRAAQVSPPVPQTPPSEHVIRVNMSEAR